MRTAALLVATLALVGCAQSDGDKDWPAEGRRLGGQLRDAGTAPTESACRAAVMTYVRDNDGPASPANRGAMRAACDAVA